ncbi:hypothetical protein [Legionella sp.]|uniref:hypothetical protein n=1 Tax=Legionella sp. TaxID=459 RepID=UPI003C9C00D7
MKMKLFAVGDSIETAEYSSWLSKTFTPVTEIPSIKTNFDKKIILNSILKCGSVQFFPSEESALNYAQSKAKEHEFDDRFVTCPVVCEVDMELIDSKQFNCIAVLSAKICNNQHTFVTQLINHYIKLDPISSFSFFNPLSLNSSVIKCTKENYHGNFDELLTPINNFTFPL